MRIWHIVLDTNVLVAALRSRRGASFLLLSLIGKQPELAIHLSVPLVLEYEDAGKRDLEASTISSAEVDAVIDYLCSVAKLHEVFFLWRPFLRDPKDDHILELAVRTRCDAIVTYNRRDFTGVERFGIEVLTPAELLQKIGLIP